MNATSTAQSVAGGSASSTGAVRAEGSAPAEPRRWLTTVAVVLVVAIVALHLVIWTLSLLLAPLGFDEAFILQAPLNLVQGNGYSTEDWMHGGPRLYFDAIVSTGPTLLMPVAGSFAIFGISIEAARLATLPFFLILLGSLVVLGRRYAGWWGAVAALSVLLVVNTREDFPLTVIYGPSDAIGEMTAASLIALALVVLPRHRALSGLVLGFAVLAKFITAMTIPVFIIAMLLVPALRTAGWGRRVREILAFLGFAAIPSVLWELVKFISLGPTAYLDALIGTLRFIFRSGSGVDGSGGANYLDRASRLFATWHMPTVLAIVVGVVLVALAVWGLWRIIVDRGTLPTRPARWTDWVRGIADGIGIDLLAAIGILASFSLWWIGVASSAFIRHTMPMLLVVVPIIAAVAVRGIFDLIRRGTAWRAATAVVIVGATVIGIVGGISSVAAQLTSPVWSRADQVATAAFVESLGADNTQGIGWWAAPSVRFLSGVPSVPVGMGTGPLILEPIMRELVPTEYQMGLDLCTEILFEQNGFVVCELDREQPVLDLGFDE